MPAPDGAAATARHSAGRVARCTGSAHGHRRPSWKTCSAREDAARALAAAEIAAQGAEPSFPGQARPQPLTSLIMMLAAVLVIDTAVNVMIDAGAVRGWPGVG